MVVSGRIGLSHHYEAGGTPSNAGTEHSFGLSSAQIVAKALVF
jgi:hypothetical protein